jgi:hypothetical protein
MMSGMPLETYWAFNKLWNNKFYYKVASCWLFLLSHTTMHGSINIKFLRNYDTSLPNCTASHKKIALAFNVVGARSLEWEGTDHPRASLIKVWCQNSKQRRHAAQNRITLFMCHDAVTSARAMISVHKHDPFPNPNSRKPIAIVTDVTTLPTTAFPFSLGALHPWRKHSLNCR